MQLSTHLQCDLTQNFVQLLAIGIGASLVAGELDREPAVLRPRNSLYPSSVRAQAFGYPTPTINDTKDSLVQSGLAASNPQITIANQV